MADAPRKDSDDDRQARLDDARRRLNKHPGYRERLAYQELGRTVNAVFIPNLDELLDVLLAPEVDEKLAVELFQNVRRPDERNRYEAAVTQRLHNYVAGAATVVDHARRLMKGRTGSIAETFEMRKAEVAATPEAAFIKDLRNFVLHNAHPFLGHTVKIEGTSGPVGKLELSAADLLAWDRWGATARKLIKEQQASFPLRPIVLRHGQLMVRLHNGLLNELAEANASALADANRLVTEWNAILGGLDIATAERVTVAVTKRRESPTPTRPEDLPAILRAPRQPDGEGV